MSNKFVFLKDKYPALFEPDCIIELTTPDYEGWLTIIDDLLSQLNSYYDKFSHSLKIRLIKEKFGGLRINYSHDDKDNICRDLNEFAINSANKTCAQCGIPGSLCVYDSEYYFTICSDCRAKDNVGDKWIVCDNDDV